MSQKNKTTRALPSPPPTAGPSNYLVRPTSSGSRSQSTSSSLHALGLGLPYENLGLPSATRGDTSNVAHVYNATIGNTTVDIVIRISTSKESPDSTLTVTCQAGGVERILGDPQTLRLSDPARVEFAVYFIPRESPPLSARYKLRIWLTTPELQVRLWADDEFWMGTKLPFTSINGARLARPVHSSPLVHIYQGFIGEASVCYTVSIDPVPYAPTHDEYSLSLRYEAGGVARELFNNLRVRFSRDMNDISFIIYSMRQESEPQGGRHKFRFWIRSAPEGICQRLWAANDVWLGRNLHFEAVQQGTVILARRGTSGPITPRLDPFVDPVELPTYSVAFHNESQ